MTELRDNRVTFDISGMHCAACAARLEQVLGAVDGVDAARVSLPLERADIDLRHFVDPSVLVAAVTQAGYTARERGASSAARRRARAEMVAEHAAEQRRTWLLALLATLVSLPFLADMTVGFARGVSGHLLDPWLQFALATVAQVVCGWRFYRSAWAALSTGFANMDVLVAVGTSAAYGLSLYNLLTGRMHHEGGLYFEAGVVVLAFLLIGKVLENKAKAGTGAALEALAAGAPQTAVRLSDGVEQNVGVDELAIGDLFVVRPGAQSPADGEVVEGQAAFDESLITGESIPVAKSPGDRIIAGALASGGRIVARVAAIGDDTRLQKIARLIDDAEISKSPTQQLADRISAVFVPFVAVISAFSCFFWWFAGYPVEHAIIVAVSVLVVACPCALGLATPIALVAGANAAARVGLIVSDHAALEAAGRVTRVAFDKTGTLTLGHPDVVGVSAADGDVDGALALAGALAGRSDHPLDRALAASSGKILSSQKSVRNFNALPGKGVEAEIDGKVYRLGNPGYAVQAGVSEEAIRQLILSPSLVDAGSIAILSQDRSVLAAFGFADPLREGVGEAVSALERLGVQVTVLSGDRKEAVAALSRNTGIKDARPGLTPEGKIDAINALRAAGDVLAMVGDGINDSPALRAADVGIAMGSGTDAAKAAAAVTLARPDPRLVAALVIAGRATRATIAQNLAFAFVFNGIGIPLAAFGKLSPALAGGAMALSSITVVLNAWRLARKDFSPGKF